jgi:hypothetical protein
MIKVLVLCFVVVLVLGASFLVPAQGDSSLPKRIEHAINEKEPGWQLKANRVRKTSEENSSLHEWQFGKGRVTVSIINAPTAEAAAENLQTSVRSIAIGQPKAQSGIGDEAYVWVGDAKGWGAVHFRQGNAVVIVRGPSAEVATRFARHVAEEMTRK